MNEQTSEKLARLSGYHQQIAVLWCGPMQSRWTDPPRWRLIYATCRSRPANSAAL